jgi:hypothetical protein
VNNSLHELSEDVVKDATVLEVSKFGLGVNADLDLELLARICGDFDLLGDLELSTVSGNVEGLLASEAKVISILAREELKWEDSHTNEV